MTERNQRVLIWATVNAPTNEREPTGNWWVRIDDMFGLIVVHEDKMLHVADIDRKKMTDQESKDWDRIRTQSVTDILHTLQNALIAKEYAKAEQLSEEALNLLQRLRCNIVTEVERL